MRYVHGTAAAASAWQRDVRTRLAALLKIDDLLARRNAIALDPSAVSSDTKAGYVLQELEISATPARRMRTRLTFPTGSPRPWPAVVCIHGHGGNRASAYESHSIYKGFAGVLTASGYATIAADVGQHAVYESGRTLMGERLWDLMRCVDYLRCLPEVDPNRIGCAGLSLGGEMAMWLGAMDDRVQATVSSGFLTRMDQMEQNHCMCWKFGGLRELVDFADIYCLIAPRALLCQNGLQEHPSQFPPSIAREVLPEIRAIYADLGAEDGIALSVHPGGHEIDIPSLTAFLAAHLENRR